MSFTTTMRIFSLGLLVLEHRTDSFTIPMQSSRRFSGMTSSRSMVGEPQVESVPNSFDSQNQNGMVPSEPDEGSGSFNAGRDPESPSVDSSQTDLLGQPRDEEELEFDTQCMQLAIDLADADPSRSPYPHAPVGAILVSHDGLVLGQGSSDYNTHALCNCLTDAGLEVTPLSEWCLTWPDSQEMRLQLAKATLYITMEPSTERHGTAMPPLTHLLQQVGLSRVVIGCASPVASRAMKGATYLHQAGMNVGVGSVCHDECRELISQYTERANSKLRRMARNHFRQFGKPLGFMHCSVVASTDVEAFARRGNAFGTEFGSGARLSYRDFGSYEIAPPPEAIWADDEEISRREILDAPTMPFYSDMDAVVATFPREGNGPPEDESLQARLNGLKWLAMNTLPPAVEKILVMDATDLADLPLENGNPNLPSFVDVESFWKGVGRKQTRVLLRRGTNQQARAAAQAAADAAQAAAVAAQAAADAIEIGEAERAADAALEFERIARGETQSIHQDLIAMHEKKAKLEALGVIVETISGGEPINIMNYLGQRNGFKTVAWRAGCWGQRGVRAILDGAFQWVSAHLAVDANGGKFWQLMLAENAVQAACGPDQKVRVLADQEDISLEYCDRAGADSECSMTHDGKPIRHIRLDSRVLLVDNDRPRNIVQNKVARFDKIVEEQAPWFL